MTKSLYQGFKATLPVSFSVAAYGSVLGILSAQKGVSFIQLILMNLTVFAGSSQFVMVDMWNPPLPLFEMALAVAIINMRYLLIGASLSPVFQGEKLGRKLAFMHMVTDENWAVTMAAQRQGATGNIYYLLGGGICVMSAWSLGTLSGLCFGAAIANPELYALDFAFTAVFTALAVSLWQGKQDVVPWLVAMATALLAENFLPGKWYILIGAVSGAISAMIGPDEKE